MKLRKMQEGHLTKNFQRNFLQFLPSDLHLNPQNKELEANEIPGSDLI
jgi:hypothetical protein